MKIRSQRANEDLKSSEQRFRATLYSIGDGVIVTEVNSRIIRMNRMAEALTGWKETEAQGKPLDEVFQIINEETRAVMENLAQRVLREGQVVGLANHSLLIARDGTEWPIADSGAPIRDESGEITGVVLVFRDQTQERTAQKALEESERKFRDTVKYLDEGYYSVTTDGLLLDHNRAFNRMLGFDTEQDVRGSRLPDFWQNPDDRGEYLTELMTQGFIRNYLINAKTINGKKIVVMANAHLVKDEKGRVVRIEGTFTDFTDHKRSEEKLRETRDRLVEAQEVAHMGSWEWDAVKDEISGSEELYRLFDVAPEGLTRFSQFVERLHPYDREHVQRDVADALEQNRPYYTDYRVKLRDGGWRYLNARGRAFTDTNGKPVRMIGTCLDIKERKRAEEALLESQARLKEAQRIGRIGNWEYDLNKKQIFWSDMVFTLYGRDPQLGPPTAEEEAGYYSAEDYARLKECAKKASEGEPYKIVVRVNLPNGGAVDAIAIGNPVLNQFGQVDKIVGTVQDITDRKRAEKALRESEKRFRTLFEQAADMILLLEIRPDGIPIIRDANIATFHILGYERDELIGKPVSFLEAAPNALELIEKRRQKVLSGEAGVFESKHRCKDGAIRDFECSVREIKVGSKTLSISIERDITERKRAEAEKAQQEAHFRQQQKLESIGTLASGIAHEINNPLSGIMNYAELIQNRLKPDEPLYQYSEKILLEGGRVAKIVRNLLTFSRQEKESHSPAFISDIIESTLSIIGAVLRKDQIKINLEIPKDLPKIKCRSQQIQQVILNLLTNARDALNERYPGYDENKIINITAMCIEKEDKEWLRITVVDFGCGIAPEIINRIFDPFFTTKPRDVGTGLGLSVSHGIIKDHNGALWADSKEGEFTRFHIELPILSDWSLDGNKKNYKNVE